MPSTASEPTVERRYADAPEFRVEQQGDAQLVYGLAVPWDSLSVPLWRDWRTNKPVRERFAPGAFRDALAAANLDVIVVRDHDPSRLLGRTASGTLRVRETGKGLEYDFDAPDTEDGRSVVVLAKRGDLRGSSFAFTVRAESWEETNDTIIRTITKVASLEDVSPVTRPAYPESKVSARAAETDPAQASLDAWRAESTSYVESHRRGLAGLASREL